MANQTICFIIIFLISMGLTSRGHISLKPSWMFLYTTLALASIVWLKFSWFSVYMLVSTLIALFCLEQRYPRERAQIGNSYNIENISHMFLRFTFAALLAPFYTHLVKVMPNLSLELSTIPVAIQTLIALLISDLINYGHHRLEHKFDFLWKMHMVHHAPKKLSALLVFRDHFLARTMIEVILLIGFSFFNFSPIAMQVYIVIRYGFAGLIAHLNVDFPKEKLPFYGYFFVLPNTHALHHAPHIKACNFGNCLTLWDHIFGTFADPCKHRQYLGAYGVLDQEYSQANFLSQQLYPLLDRVYNQKDSPPQE